MINLTQQYLPQSRALIDILWRVQVNKEGNTDCQVQSMINLFTEVRVCLTDSHHETRLIPGRTEEVASQCCLLEGENVTAGRQPPGGRTVDCGLWTVDTGMRGGSRPASQQRRLIPHHLTPSHNTVRGTHKQKTFPRSELLSHPDLSHIVQRVFCFRVRKVYDLITVKYVNIGNQLLIAIGLVKFAKTSF